MKIFKVEYDSFKDLRLAKTPLSICPIGAHSDESGGSVTAMTLDAHVDLIYTLREDHCIQIQSPDFPDKEIFSYICELAYIIFFTCDW